MILFYGIIFLFANKKNKKRIFLTCPSGEQREERRAGGFLVAGMQVESIPPFLGDRFATDIAPPAGFVEYQTSKSRRDGISVETGTLIHLCA